MAIKDVKVPSPGESITEVEIANWVKQNGDWVEKDDVIGEIDSDKATLELVAEEAGAVKILVEAGTTVKVGAVVCQIDTDAAKPAGAAPKKEAVAAAPAAKKEEAPKAEATVEASYAAGHPSVSAKKLMDENGVAGGKVN